MRRLYGTGWLANRGWNDDIESPFPVVYFTELGPWVQRYPRGTLEKRNEVFRFITYMR